MDMASGSVIVQHYRRHRHSELLCFLKIIDAAVPNGLDLHLVCDNYPPTRPRRSASGCCAIPVTELEVDIRKSINAWNRDPRPFVWTKTADEILDTLASYCRRINDSGR